MSLRTYLPFLRFLMLRVCNYIRRHEQKIKENVGEANEILVDAVIVACEALLVVLNAIIPEGT